MESQSLCVILAVTLSLKFLWPLAFPWYPWFGSQATNRPCRVWQSSYNKYLRKSIDNVRTVTPFWIAVWPVQRRIRRLSVSSRCTARWSAAPMWQLAVRLWLRHKWQPSTLEITQVPFPGLFSFFPRALWLCRLKQKKSANDKYLSVVICTRSPQTVASLSG